MKPFIRLTLGFAFGFVVVYGAEVYRRHGFVVSVQRPLLSSYSSAAALVPGRLVGAPAGDHAMCERWRAAEWSEEKARACRSGALRWTETCHIGVAYAMRIMPDGNILCEEVRMDFCTDDVAPRVPRDAYFY